MNGRRSSKKDKNQEGIRKSEETEAILTKQRHEIGVILASHAKNLKAIIADDDIFTSGFTGDSKSKDAR
jgi:hypothetical protein